MEFNSTKISTINYQPYYIRSKLFDINEKCTKILGDLYFRGIEVTLHQRGSIDIVFFNRFTDARYKVQQFYYPILNRADDEVSNKMVSITNFGTLGSAISIFDKTIVNLEITVYLNEPATNM